MYRVPQHTLTLVFFGVFGLAQPTKMLVPKFLIKVLVAQNLKDVVTKSELQLAKRQGHICKHIPFK
jgi:hypothetical protein